MIFFLHLGPGVGCEVKKTTLNLTRV